MADAVGHVELPDARGDRRLRKARAVVIGTYALFALMPPMFAAQGVYNSLHGGLTPLWSNLAGLALTLPLTLLTALMAVDRVLHPERNGGRRAELLFWTSAALLSAVCGLLDLYLWTLFIVAAWWSVAVLVSSRIRTVLVTAVLLLAPWARLATFPDPDPVPLIVIWLFAGGWGLGVLIGNYCLLWLWEVAAEAAAGRTAQARLAVSEERLRFSRDMHDLLGHSLSGMAVKSELAARLATRDPDRAESEMRAVQEMAREALREVRTAISGYRRMDLDTETAGVAAVITASGARCTVTGSGADLPEETATLAAWVVREAATNVLRHAAPTRCAIGISREDGAVVVEVANDGVAASGGPAGFGNGLTGLTERVATAGGTLTAGPDGARGFRLRAVLPSGPDGSGTERQRGPRQREDADR